VSQRGAASVESVALALLVGLLFSGLVASVVAGPLDGGRELGTAIARKLRCAPRLPGPCWRDPLTEAYGRPLAGLVRALAPIPAARVGRSGMGLMPVDFRYCRRESCAIPGPDPAHLTASNRRVTAFTSVEDRRRSGGWVEVSYWLYRPGLGWERMARRASPADVAAHARTPLLEDADPRLVPLETLAGRNHLDFPAAEEPPWRWRGSQRPAPVNATLLFSADRGELWKGRDEHACGASGPGWRRRASVRHGRGARAAGSGIRPGRFHIHPLRQRRDDDRRRCQ
jgi:hypothetical protein